LKAGSQKRGLRGQKQPAFVRFTVYREYRANGVFQTREVIKEWILTKAVGRGTQFRVCMEQEDPIMELSGGLAPAFSKVSTMSAVKYATVAKVLMTWRNSMRGPPAY
jgi:hypothetical protein